MGGEFRGQRIGYGLPRIPSRGTSGWHPRWIHRKVKSQRLRIGYGPRAATSKRGSGETLKVWAVADTGEFLGIG